MEKELFLIPVGVFEKHALSEITNCNLVTAQYGLSLSAAEAKELLDTRARALVGNGRIEVGGGIIDKIIKEFCDSPYLYQGNYTETLHDLVEIFYYYKNETHDLISDDELVEWMKKYYDSSCQGSIELLKYRELDKLAHDVLRGTFDFNSRYDLSDYYDSIQKGDDDDGA